MKDEVEEKIINDIDENIKQNLNSLEECRQYSQNREYNAAITILKSVLDGLYDCVKKDICRLRDRENLRKPVLDTAEEYLDLMKKMNELLHNQNYSEALQCLKDIRKVKVAQFETNLTKLAGEE